jgi:hypothetical protein
VSLTEDLVRKISQTEHQYRRRVNMMAGIYVLLNITAIISVVIIIWYYKFFITVAQRSNMETLTLAIIIVLFSYLVVTTFGGVIGACKMLFYNLPLGGGAETPKQDGNNKQDGKLTQDPGEEEKSGLPPGRRKIEERKQAALKPGKDEVSKAYFNIALEAEDKPDEPIRIPVEDEAGKLGEMIIDGAEARFEAEKRGISNTIFEYLLNQIQDCLRERDPELDMQIVAWSTIDDEKASQYRSQVQAFRTLAAQLEKGPIWPTCNLTRGNIAYIRTRLREIVPYLRNEAFLPDVEYQAEYSLPIIPEPLGFVSLRRTEQRADPVATMGCASLVTLGVMALLILFIFFPPWLPSK